MVQDSKLTDFPDINNKLGVPSKKSQFERQKAEAEAKRQREQEETAAVYEDFVKSFDDEGDDARRETAAPGRGGMGQMGSLSKRQFAGTPTGPPGRAGLGPGKSHSGPGSLGPPPTLSSRKRPYDVSEPTRRDGILAYDNGVSGPADPKVSLAHSDDEGEANGRASTEKVVPKPTMRLTSLPPGVSPAAIKAVIPETLQVEAVRIVPPSGPGTTGTERRSVTAIVTMSSDTPAADIDSVVSTLQNRYMGRGYYLSLSRHLSTASANVDSLNMKSLRSSLPFGARPIPQPMYGRAAPFGSHRGGYAPPVSYNPPQTGRPQVQYQVVVTPPSDLRQLKLIHKTIENLIQHGPEFEALLMTRKEVQQNEIWAWLWDARSVGGVYYRWKIWEIMSGFIAKRSRATDVKPQQLFDTGPAWVPPEHKLPFEYVTDLADFIDDSDYNSSEDDDSGNEGRKRYAMHNRGAPPPEETSMNEQEETYLNPLQKAKLVHLLARLPTANTKLRRGDVARITAFAVQHAGEGADETVELIVANTRIPLNFTSANPDWREHHQKLAKAPEINQAHDLEHVGQPTQNQEEEEDNTSAKMVALYIISDILSSSSTSGVRHAWRYRQLFESQMRRQQVFEHLGRLEKTQNWGRLRAEKWKRSVNSILSLWEGWCVFSQASQEHFVKVFNDPPMTAEESAMKEVADAEEKKNDKLKKRWKTVDEKANERAASEEASAEATMNDDFDGEPMDDDEEDLDGGSMVDDEDLDGEAMAESDDASDSEHGAIAASPDALQTPETQKPSEDDATRRAALAASIAAKLSKTTQTSTAPSPTDPAPPNGRKRQRPRAEDMFASDEE